MQMKTGLKSGLLAAMLAAGLAAPALARDLTVVSWGGNYQDGQREIYFKPFAEKTSRAASRISSRFSCWMRVRRGTVASMFVLKPVGSWSGHQTGPILWTSFCLPVERALDAAFPLVSPLTAGTAVLTFVQPVKICVAQKDTEDQASGASKLGN